MYTVSCFSPLLGYASINSTLIPFNPIKKKKKAIIRVYVTLCYTDN